MKAVTNEKWPVKLYSKSALKQRKFEEISKLLGETSTLRCLDIGADNGVISYFLRKGSGSWASADLDETSVQSIRDLVQDDVFRIDGTQTSFQDDEFDRVVIVDFLEHIPTDQQFIDDLFRIIKPGGELIINTPNVKNSLLRRFRLAIGQTDEKHGHLRPGYSPEDLDSLLEGKFETLSRRTYSKFFSEAVDTLITLSFGMLKRDKSPSSKGMIVVGQDLQKFQKLFRAYSMIYPLVWSFVKLDKLLFWRSGYMLIVSARSLKG